MNTKDTLLYIMASFFGLIIILGIIWAFQGNDFLLLKYFAPKYEQVRRDTFEQSKAYRQGMIQELQSMQLEYFKASPEHKQALRSVILHRSADFPIEDMPADLKTFITILREERKY